MQLWIYQGNFKTERTFCQYLPYYGISTVVYTEEKPEIIVFAYMVVVKVTAYSISYTE